MDFSSDVTHTACVFISPLDEQRTVFVAHRMRMNQTWRDLCMSATTAKSVDFPMSLMLQLRQCTAHMLKFPVDLHPGPIAATLTRSQLRNTGANTNTNTNTNTNANVAVNRFKRQAIYQDYNMAASACKTAAQKSTRSIQDVLRLTQELAAAVTTNEKNEIALRRTCIAFAPISGKMECTLNGFGPAQIEDAIKRIHMNRNKPLRVTRAQLSNMSCYHCMNNVVQRTRYFAFGCGGVRNSHVICLSCLSEAVFQACEESIYDDIFSGKYKDVCIGCPLRCAGSTVCISETEKLVSFSILKPTKPKAKPKEKTNKKRKRTQAKASITRKRQRTRKQKREWVFI